MNKYIAKERAALENYNSVATIENDKSPRVSQLATLNNIRLLRADARHCPLDVLIDLHNKIGSIIDDRKAQESQEEAQRREYENKLAKFRELMLAEGVDPDDVLNTDNLGNKGIRRSPTVYRMRYEYTDDYGRKLQWNGQGRIPHAIKREIEAGRKIFDDFLIITK